MFGKNANFVHWSDFGFDSKSIEEAYCEVTANSVWVTACHGNCVVCVRDEEIVLSIGC